MPFVKLDCAITEATIFCEPNEVFKAWITLLVKAGPDGIARITAPALGLLCRVSTERAQEILDQFCKPDPYSRSLNKAAGDDGTRLRRVDGGYLIVNYDKHRQRDYTHAERQRRYRDAHRDASPPSRDTVTPSLVTQAEAEAEEDIEGAVTTPARKRAVSIPSDFTLTPERLLEAQKRRVDNPELEFEKFRAHHEAHGKAMRNWDAAWRTWCMNYEKFGGTATRQRLDATHFGEGAL